MNGRIHTRRVKGQSAVMVSLLIMIVVMLIAFTTNLGKLVTEKIAMQNAVDLAVYSGAATQAGYLNKLRKINHDIWKVHEDVRRTLDPSESRPGFPYLSAIPLTGCNPCCGPNMLPGQQPSELAPPYLIGQRARIIAYQGQFVAMNNQAGPSAVESATRAAANANYSGTSGKIQFKSQTRPIMPVTNSPLDWSYKGWKTVINVPTCPFPSGLAGAMMVTETTAPSWYYRNSTPGDIMVAAGIENATPNSPFLDGGYLGQFFAGNCKYGGGTGGRCALNVYAAAHPHHGKMGSVKGGSAPWEQTWDMVLNNPSPMSVDTKSSLDDHKPFGADYYDYKVRFIGIFETDAQVLGGNPLRSAVGQYGSRMQH